MIGSIELKIPLIFSAVASFLVILAGIRTVRIFRERNERGKRKLILETFTEATSSQIKSAQRQFLVAKAVVDLYGNRLVNTNYKTKLQKMLVSSGDLDAQRYSNLLRRKILFSVIGFASFFFSLLYRDLTALPVVASIIIVAYVLPDLDRLVRKIFSKKYRRRLASLLDRAGNWEETDYFRLVRRKLLFSVGGFILGYIYLVSKTGSAGNMLYSAMGLFFGFFIPDVLLQNRVLKRKEVIANTLPDAIDMLQMCVGAGLAFPAALSRVADTQSGPVAEEFSRVTAEVQLGKSRSDALAGMAARTQERNVQKFVSAMQQVTTFGIPVHNVLVEQAKEMRAMRRELARERGQKVPIKILGPIMLFFLPTVLIMVLGPAIISLIASLG
jgi:tight adherence protein C